MRVLVACEESGVVRDAFTRLGHDAISCDLLPSRSKGQHLEKDIFEVLEIMDGYFDLMIAFPPCTHLCVSGARWFKNKQEEQKDAIEFFLSLVDADIPKIAIENPIGVMSSHYRKPHQIIQPWMFGHGETNATCLWLKNLPRLAPTNIVEGREARIHKMPPGENRARDRSVTYTGIAEAMASQWGIL